MLRASDIPHIASRLDILGLDDCLLPEESEAAWESGIALRKVVLTVMHTCM